MSAIKYKTVDWYLNGILDMGWLCVISCDTVFEFTPTKTEVIFGVKARPLGQLNFKFNSGATDDPRKAMRMAYFWIKENRHDVS